MASPGSSSPTDEQALLSAARRGDEQAFGRLIESYRRELHAHCYRMLGSVQDAEDALQEATLRAWRAIGRFEGRSSLRSWLYTIATNTCLNAISRRPAQRVLPLDAVSSLGGGEGIGLPLAETVWIEPYPDQPMGIGDGFAAPDSRYEEREGVELAFIAAVQHLPATQRAVLLLREVLGYSAREVAEVLETSVQAVNSALQRARAAVESKLPERSQQANLRSLGDEKVRIVVERYMDAMQRGDVPAVVSMLQEEAAWSMPPLTSWFRGLEDLEGFLRHGPLTGEYDWRHLPASANGQAAVATYTRMPDGRYMAFSLDILTLGDDGRIVEVCSFIIRSTESEDADYYQHWPRYPVDPDRFDTVFGRLGLPQYHPDYPAEVA
jgi:RNA polymerase sigma-70 factor (ECF subfamily)